MRIKMNRKIKRKCLNKKKFIKLDLYINKYNFYKVMEFKHKALILEIIH